jgi:hypothetical protein
MATNPVHPDTQKMAEQGCGSLMTPRWSKRDSNY